VLAGGRTPEALYRLLARQYLRRFPWAETEVFFGDERCVPARDPESNFAMARDALLAHVPIPRHRIYRLQGEVRPAAAAARRYANVLQSLAQPGDPSAPRFDVVLLGLGPDGHTASLFPNAPALRETERLVLAVPSVGVPPQVPRLTLTLPALASSREIVFLVAGADKAAIVANVLNAGPSGAAKYPASLVHSAGPVLWFLDSGAAGSLSA
jgi:6-phosphogluconolactonase